MSESPFPWRSSLALTTAILAFSLLFRLDAQAQASRYSVYEIALTSSNSYANPYTQVVVSATFTGPGGVTKSVKGFWDGGNSFKVRFTPTLIGTWNYSIASTPADSGLTRSGTITVGAPLPGKRGFVRRDPAHPYSFVFDDGSRYFMFGQTYYEILRLATAGGAWKTSIDNTKLIGMNKIRMMLYPFNASGTNLPEVRPFQGTVSSPDRDRLNIPFWQKYDEVLQYMDAKGMIAEIILFFDGSISYGTQVQDERFVRYALARFAAYPNVIFDLCNEWDLSAKPKSYWDTIGRIVRNEDPWQLEGSAARRPLSIHAANGRQFQFFDSSWPVHAILQYTNFMEVIPGTDPVQKTCRFRTPSVDENSNTVILQNMGHNMPVVNDEIGYVSGTFYCPQGDGSPLTRTEFRNIMWAIVTAGGYVTHGDSSKVNGNYVHISGEWLSLPGYHDDIKRLIDYFTTRGIGYWSMTSQNALKIAGSRVYVLGKVGLGYVVYAAVGGSFTLNLPEGNYSVEWFNPVTGAFTTGSAVSGGSRSFTPPFSGDAVLRLDVQGSVQSFSNQQLRSLNRCLHAVQDANGANVVIRDCNGSPNQIWTYTTGRQLRAFGKCLDVANSGTANESNVVLNSCSGGTSQLWSRISSNGFSPDHAAGKCLDVYKNISADDQNVQIYSCNGGLNQQWVVENPVAAVPSAPSNLRLLPP